MAGEQCDVVYDDDSDVDWTEHADKQVFTYRLLLLKVYPLMPVPLAN